MAASAVVPIIAHVDVRRMLITMRALTRGARIICYATAVALDRGHLAGDAAACQAGQDRAALLTPVADVMTGRVVAATPDTPVSEIAALLDTASSASRSSRSCRRTAAASCQHRPGLLRSAPPH